MVLIMEVVGREKEGEESCRGDEGYELTARTYLYIREQSRFAPIGKGPHVSKFYGDIVLPIVPGQQYPL